ncbi:MAG TPA: LacI family DNA-binding transcriptional regulator [Haliscomenobacter sp.]|uniref:LacI family DNA-binding transcriptional regulator n=1 Tax=Haliscomenobacter sp. TaxID=2717303 RepID=UPI002BA55054|nr:LacI family DNA-binding transcriptional regulator [Haliscomenobacter sp.]HOY19495.1 LacI family DNA-binding transcriptional regulator [Haliscomenobacter sp.]HPH20551.1 LacI family DNA-binding transcriptional regulator [Haliscomenobacter sp.]
MPQVSIKDIARMLNISVATVSRALHDRYDVNPETKRKVLELAEKLNYRPNSHAIGLLTKRTHTIGLVVPEIDNQFFSEIINGLENVAYEQGYNVMIFQSQNIYEREVKIIDQLIGARVDGVAISIGSSTEDFRHLNMLKELDIPLAMFDRAHDKVYGHKIINDNFDGGYKAGAFLIKSGRQRLAHIAGPATLKLSRLRLQGFKAALRDAQLELRPEYLVHTTFRMEDSYQTALNLLRLLPRPDAIFAVSDYVALGVLKAARELDIKIPQELALIGFTNLAVGPLLEPPLTTISQQSYEMGQETARILLENIESSEEDFKLQTRIFKPELVIRDSV